MDIQLLLLISAGMFTGAVLSLVVFGLMTPVFIGMGLLVNKPDGLEKSGFHMFTYPEEGKVKIVTRGDRIIRMIMLFADHQFARRGDEGSAAHWEIEPKPGKGENPLHGILWFLYPWAWYVYVLTGAVFTGIYPFQTVREYLLERTKMHRGEERGRNNNIILEVEEDISDHLRVRQFLYPFRVAAADTQDKISVNVLAVIKAHVKNPHKAAFGTDRWDQQLVNLASNAVTNYTRTHTLDEVLSASDETTVDGINNAIEEIKSDEEQYGIQIDGVDLIDISPNLSDEEKTRLYAEALAKTEGKATVIDGQSRAAALRAINEANKDGGEFAIETMRSEALVRAAEAAKGGTVILPMGGTDPTQAAILAELRKQNNRTP